jgi:hypothetical protein
VTSQVFLDMHCKSGRVPDVRFLIDNTGVGFCFGQGSEDPSKLGPK